MCGPSQDLHLPIGESSSSPQNESISHPWKKEHHRLKSAFEMGYVCSQEGIFSLKVLCVLLCAHELVCVPVFNDVHVVTSPTTVFFRFTSQPWTRCFLSLTKEAGLSLRFSATGQAPKAQYPISTQGCTSVVLGSDEPEAPMAPPTDLEEQKRFLNIEIFPTFDGPCFIGILIKDLCRDS